MVTLTETKFSREMLRAWLAEHATFKADTLSWYVLVGDPHVLTDMFWYTQHDVILRTLTPRSRNAKL